MTVSVVVLYTYSMSSISKSKLTRVYADTSVFGGVFDEEFETASKVLFDAIKKGSFKLITSELVREEIQVAPKKVIDIFEEFLVIAEIAEITDSALQLQQSYLEAGVVSEKYATDAMHVALATVSSADLIVSWNFKHIVNFQKIPLHSCARTSARDRPSGSLHPFACRSHDTSGSAHRESAGYPAGNQTHPAHPESARP